MMDFDELKLVEKERYELAVRGANLGLWDWNVLTGKVTYNDNWAEMLGYTLDEVEGTLMEWKRLVHVNDLKRVEKKLQAHLSGETEVYKTEHRLRTKDGSYKWILDMGRVIKRDENGQALRVVGIHHDIHQKKTAELNLKKQIAYFQELFEKSPEAIILLDKEAKVIKVNKSFENLFGYTEAEVKEQLINNFIIPSEEIETAEKIDEMIKNGKTYFGEGVRKDKNGRRIDVAIHAYPIKLDEDQLGIYGVYNDISERKIEEEKIKYLSFHDQLTSLYNRRYFENELERLNNSRQVPISIIVADLDGLKEINDNFGHKEGDIYIKIAANVIKASVREEDIVARIGGDEFAVILPGTEHEAAGEIIARIEQYCQEINNQMERGLSISCGCETLADSSQDLNQIFKEADDMMYEKKKQKKCRS